MTKHLYDLRFKVPANFLITGPSSSGKTSFLVKLLQNAESMMTKKPVLILFYYNQWQNLYDRVKNIEGCTVIFKKGAPESLEHVQDELKQFPLEDAKICVMDDMLGKLEGFMEELFTVISHHYNTSMVLISQTIFGKKELRTISLNAHYMVVFKAPRDSMQFSVLARQIEPNNYKYLLQILQDATKRPFGYLILNFTQEMRDESRYYTNISPSNWPIKIYPPKGFFN